MRASGDETPPLRSHAFFHDIIAILRFILFLAGVCLSCLSARAASPLDEILGNMGNIGLNGLPNLSFDLGERAELGELASLGIKLKLTHRVSLRHGRMAKTEWVIPSLQTYAHIDQQGDVTWLSPTGRTVRFRKAEDGYTNKDDSSSIKVFPDTGIIEITTRAYTRWHYKEGFLEAVSNRRCNYAIMTNCGILVSVSKTTGNRTQVLLDCAYSKQGLLEQVKLQGGKEYWFQWSADCLLTAAGDNASKRFDFEYTDSLLTCWTATDGMRNDLKWQYLDQRREAAFQRPPVHLVEDAGFAYYWECDDGADTVTVRDKTGALVSETKIGARGLEQVTPSGTVKYRSGTASEPSK